MKLLLPILILIFSLIDNSSVSTQYAPGHGGEMDQFSDYFNEDKFKEEIKVDFDRFDSDKVFDQEC